MTTEGCCINTLHRQINTEPNNPKENSKNRKWSNHMQASKKTEESKEQKKKKKEETFVALQN